MKYYITTKSGRYFRKPGDGVTIHKSEAHKYTKSEAEKLISDLSISGESVESYKLVPIYNKKILILGDARHGKDTVTEMIRRNFGLTFKGSSTQALETFLFDVLNEKYKKNYKTLEEAHNDRVNCRDIWYDEITEFNSVDKLRLTKIILEKTIFTWDSEILRKSRKLLNKTLLT